MIKFSNTYFWQIAQFIAFALTLININVGVDELTTTITVIATIISGIGVFIGRYKAGGITMLGFRK